MRRENAVRKFYILLFVVAICLPWLLWVIFGKYIDSDNYENRNLASRPVFRIDTYENYTSEYEAYYNDNLPFRNTLISLYSRLNYYLFHSSTNNHVIIGKEGWLFYADAGDGDPLACYQGKKLFHEEQLREMADNLLSIQKCLSERGVEFVIVIAPNKERVYSEMMPDFYGAPADEYAVRQVVNYIKEHTDIRIVFPYEEIMDAKKQLEDMILYHKVDTHWNNLGAYIGSKALLQALDIHTGEITSNNLKASEIENTACDLAGMINMSTDLQGNECDYNILLDNVTEADARKVYMVRDSFGLAMIPYLDAWFEESSFAHIGEYNYDDFLEKAPNIFIIEVVERYVDALASFKLY